MGRLFGTDGVRGIANTELTAETAYKLGQAGAYILASESKHTARIVVGTDTRISCDMLEASLVAGICSVGSEAMCLGVVPSPAVAYLTRHFNADAGLLYQLLIILMNLTALNFFNNRDLNSRMKPKIRLKH